jgi:hypothetical protein
VKPLLPGRDERTWRSNRYPMADYMSRICARIEEDVKKGGNHIEYHDEDPRVHRMFVEERATTGLVPRTDELAPAGGA